MVFLQGLLGGDSDASPLMTAITYTLVAEAAAIIFLSLPFQIKFRRTIAELLVTSPVLSTLRIVFITTCGFLTTMLGDKFLRLQRLNARTPTNVFTAENMHATRNGLQRDLFVLASTLFCAVVLYQVELLLLRMGRYRKQRNALADQVRSLGAEPVRVLGLEGAKGGKILPKKQM
ncbi:hypothetical protein HDU86_003924 [Geranomyces michiganensis]|nr:hypothetical protein HDU86_003924 [Geranomyces michiganensis]